MNDFCLETRKCNRSCKQRMVSEAAHVRGIPPLLMEPRHCKVMSSTITNSKTLLKWLSTRQTKRYNTTRTKDVANVQPASMPL